MPTRLCQLLMKPATYWSLFALGVLFGLPLVLPSASAIHPDYPLHPPILGLYWLGTDELGRDLLARLLLGGQISIAVGLSTALVSTVFGFCLALLASAYPQKWPDQVILRVIDILYSLPGMLLVVVMGLFFGRSLPSLVLTLALFSWPDTTRILRSHLIQLRQEDYMQAFTILGGSFWGGLSRHLFPNSLRLIWVCILITVPRAILTESTLSFVGLGIAPPLSSWGTMIQDGWQVLRLAPHLLFAPALMMLALQLGLQTWARELQR
jgi:oligopeptide transport system permease protein